MVEALDALRGWTTLETLFLQFDFWVRFQTDSGQIPVPVGSVGRNAPVPIVGVRTADVTKA